MRRNTAGIGLKLRPADRALIDRAAALADVTLSELVRRAAVARARRIIAEAGGASVLADGKGGGT